MKISLKELKTIIKNIIRENPQNDIVTSIELGNSMSNIKPVNIYKAILQAEKEPGFQQSVFKNFDEEKLKNIKEFVFTNLSQYKRDLKTFFDQYNNNKEELIEKMNEVGSLMKKIKTVVLPLGEGKPFENNLSFINFMNLLNAINQRKGK
jgi:hypothetical protein